MSESIVMSIRIPKSLREQINKIAETQDRSVNWVCVKYLQKGAEREIKKK
jgi:predicted transcriptional regulator